jgi:hypothetical protein
MIQHNQIGKYKSKQSIIDSKLNKVYITPQGNEYSLIEFRKIGHRRHYVYNWVNCPDNVRNKLTTTTFLALFELNPIQVDEVITEKNKIANGYYD